MNNLKDYFELGDDQEDELQVEEYELTSSPNDFNTSTIFNFVESGAVKIPGFQRNYVWDIKRASKLIESLIIGLPVPQIFLYEEDKNKFLVIDGQQRLMSIYYFRKQRFPRKEKRTELRRIFDENGEIPHNILEDDAYFEKFNLRLQEISPGRSNKFSGRNYSTLEEYKVQFDLRTIRNVIVKQNVPKDDDSSVYEMFNRLNTGGINLTPQEIRASLYHSNFYDMLGRLNMLKEWRRIVGIAEPDLHMRDIEVLLRGFAMLVDGDNYGSSMARFLNGFSKSAKCFDKEKVQKFEGLASSFIKTSSVLPENIYFGKSGKFSVTLFESVFAAVCRAALQVGSVVVQPLRAAQIEALRNDEKFLQYSQAQSNKKSNVDGRLRRARELLGA